MQLSDGKEKLSFLDAKLSAQKICFAPIVFQVARIMCSKGILELIKKNNYSLTKNELAGSLKLSEYALSVLLDAGVSIGLIDIENDRYGITPVGENFISDEIVKVHMDFIQDVCYQGMFFLEEALEQEIPAGLKVFGDWETIYEGLSELPQPVQKSWFNFDHFFSDNAFAKALKIVLKKSPLKVLDIGGNTGKWAVQCAKYSPDISVTILDHPGQLKMAEQNVKNLKLSRQIDFVEMNILDHSQDFPEGYDIIWMSQFLDCFSKNDIVQILQRAKRAVNKNGSIFIMETFTDNQRFEVSAFCLNMISLYFTCMANGNSRMYPLKEFESLIEEAGLKIEKIYPKVGLTHTIIKCS